MVYDLPEPLMENGKVEDMFDYFYSAHLLRFFFTIIVCMEYSYSLYLKQYSSISTN